MDVHIKIELNVLKSMGIIFLMFFNIFINAQNIYLIPNPPFENRINCLSDSWNSFQLIDSWFNPTQQTFV